MTAVNIAVMIRSFRGFAECTCFMLSCSLDLMELNKVLQKQIHAYISFGMERCASKVLLYRDDQFYSVYRYAFEAPYDNIYVIYVLTGPGGLSHRLLWQSFPSNEAP